MKNYSRTKNTGRLSYRTPSRFIVKKTHERVRVQAVAPTRKRAAVYPLTFFLHLLD